VLRNKHVPGREEVAGGWRQLHMRSSTDTHSSSNILRGDQMEKEMGMACMAEKRNVYRFLVGKPERKKPLGRNRCRWDHT